MYRSIKRGLIESLDDLVKYNEPVGDAAVVLAWIFDRKSEQVPGAYL